MAEIRLEVASENSVLEIQYDGHEIRQPPLSMSEELALNANKIDFGASENGGLDEPMEEEEESESKEEEEKPYQQAHWPLEGVRNKIRTAHTEICVLHDLLQIVKDKRSLVLDQVTAQPSPSKLYIVFLALKKSLSNASNMLSTGSERIRNFNAEARFNASHPVNNSKPVDFHMELLKLRKDWKLKRVASSIVGDLSYTPTGSQFKHNAYFEVTKADESSTATPFPSSPQVTLGGVTHPPKPRASSLKVTIPPELEGSAYLFVGIKKDEEDLCSTQLSLSPSSISSSEDTSSVPTEGHWQKKLECAQNVLYCKELFSQLAREAVYLTMDIPPLVVSNQIIATIFPGIHLVISLCHSRPASSSTTSNGMNGTKQSADPNKSQHDSVLEHSLHQLLHQYLQKRHPLPHPAYASHLSHPTRRLAGPQGIDRKKLLDTITNETLLEQIIKEAQHNFLRMRTMFVIDELAIEWTDPLIISHWDLFNSPKQSCVRVNIVTQGYDSVIRTSLIVHVYERSLRCVCRDGRVMTMSFEPQELRDLLKCQISQHQVAAVQSLSKVMGWTVISSEPCLGVGNAEYLGSAAAVVLHSAAGNKSVMVRSGPGTGVTAFVATAPRNDFYPSAVVQEGRWDQLQGSWQEVKLAAVEGKNVLAKIETLMSALTAQN